MILNNSNVRQLIETVSRRATLGIASGIRHFFLSAVPPPHCYPGEEEGHDSVPSLPQKTKKEMKLSRTYLSKDGPQVKTGTFLSLLCYAHFSHAPL
jgi:hypothetical protein